MVISEAYKISIESTHCWTYLNFLNTQKLGEKSRKSMNRILKSGKNKKNTKRTLPIKIIRPTNLKKPKRSGFHRIQSKFWMNILMTNKEIFVGKALIEFHYVRC